MLRSPEIRQRDRERAARSRANNPELYREISRRSRAKNKDKYNLQRRLKRTENIEEAREKDRARIRVYNRPKKARKPGRTREEKLALLRERYATDPIYADMIRSRQRIRYASDPMLKERERKRTIQRKIANPDRYAEVYRKNKDKMAAAAKIWRAENPVKARDISRKNNHKRRVQKAISQDHYTLAEIRELRSRVGGRCALCGTKGRMTIDHIVPLARGGSNGIRNIQFLCKSCNSKKQDKDPVHFAQECGFLI